MLKAARTEKGTREGDIFIKRRSIVAAVQWFGRDCGDV